MKDITKRNASKASSVEHFHTKYQRYINRNWDGVLLGSGEGNISCSFVCQILVKEEAVFWRALQIRPTIQWHTISTRTWNPCVESAKTTWSSRIRTRSGRIKPDLCLQSMAHNFTRHWSRIGKIYVHCARNEEFRICLEAWCIYTVHIFILSTRWLSEGRVRCTFCWKSHMSLHSKKPA